MASQSNKLRRSLNNISSNILSNQSADIRSYTAGHLNESHLFRPTQLENGHYWEGKEKKAYDASSKWPDSVIPLPLLISKSLRRNNQKKNQTEGAATQEKGYTKLPAITMRQRLEELPLSDKELALNFLKSQIKSSGNKYENMKNLFESDANAVALTKSYVFVNERRSVAYLERTLNEVGHYIFLLKALYLFFTLFS